MRLRWYIGGLLFLSTVINYIDRQTLSVLAPYIKTEFQWSNTDFAMLIIAFRDRLRRRADDLAAALLDRVGTRTGLTVERGVLLGGGDADLACDRIPQPRVLPLPARSRRVGQLARRDQGGVRVVSAEGKRMGGGAV